ncbi:hypothetical protein D3C72_1826790 [compost metagenome]
MTRKGRALSRSASSNTSWGDLPPSSSVTGTALIAAACWMATPTPVEPVKDRWLTPGCAASTAPASAPVPVTTFRAPAGRPQFSAMRAKARAVSEACSAGFSTAALPTASAATTDRPMICIG